jgi:hypothetical protein
MRRSGTSGRKVTDRIRSGNWKSRVRRAQQLQGKDLRKEKFRDEAITLPT